MSNRKGHLSSHQREQMAFSIEIYQKELVNYSVGNRQTSI